MLLRILGFAGAALLVIVILGARTELDLLITGDHTQGTIIAKSLDDRPSSVSVWPGIPLPPTRQGIIMVRFHDRSGEQVIMERVGYFESLFSIDQTVAVVHPRDFPEAGRVSHYLLLIWQQLLPAGAAFVLLTAAFAIGVYRWMKRHAQQGLAPAANPDIRADLDKTFDPHKLYERRDR